MPRPEHGHVRSIVRLDLLDDNIGGSNRSSLSLSPLASKRAFLSNACACWRHYFLPHLQLICTHCRDTDTPLFGALMGICSSCLGLNRHPSQQAVRQSHILK